MKKLVTIVLSLILLLSVAMLAACNSGTDTDLTTTSSSSDMDRETSDSFIEDASSDISEMEESMTGNVELTTTDTSDEASTDAE